MSQPITVTVDSAKGIARMSGPLVLGNTYDLSFDGVADEPVEVVVLGRPQIAGEWEQADNPTVRVAARSGDGVLAMTTQELAEAFRYARPLPPHPPLPADPRKPFPLPGALLHGAANPHGAIQLHFYVTGDGTTLAQGDLTLLWAPFEYDGDGTPIVFQGPKGDKGETGPQGPQGERGADAIIATSTGCVTFRVDFDMESPTYGHLFAYADNDVEMYHDGDRSKPHFWLGTGTNGGLAGHLYYTYYPAEPDIAPTAVDLGAVVGPASHTAEDFIAILKANMEAARVTTPATNVNTGLALANAVWDAIIRTASRYAALALACILPVLAFLFAGTAFADAVETLGEMDPTNRIYTAEQVDNLLEDAGRGKGFPLDENANFAGYAATNVGSLQLAGSTNELTVDAGRLLYGGSPVGPAIEAGHGIGLSTNTNTLATVVGVNRDIDFDNVIILGDLTVSGTQHHHIIIRHETNVYVGIRTNYITTEVYSTNHVYQYTHIVTRDTNYVDEVVNVGGNVDHSKAASVLSPSFSIDNSDTNSPALTGIGTWDLSECDINLGEDCYVSPHVKTVDESGTNTFSANDFYLQQLDLSGETDAEVCWNKPTVAPYALMHCRVRIGTDNGCAAVTWATNNVRGLDATAISTNGWSWVQLESYPGSADFSVVAQWSEETEGGQ